MSWATSWGRATALTALGILVAGCAETQFFTHTSKKISKAQETAPKTLYKVGEPYQINGVWYYPREDFEYDETGIASWYGPQFHGRSTANGEVFDMNKVSAAHPTLQMPTFVRVTNLENGRSLVVRVNDRGPFARGRIIDLSRRSAQLLGFEAQGTARVRVQVMNEESRVLAAQLKSQGVQVAQADSPIIVDTVRRPTVTAEALPPPDGEVPQTSARPRLVGGALPPAMEQTAVASVDPAVGVLIQGVAPRATTLHVQAGAFAFQDNAQRVKSRLASLGGVVVSPVGRNGKDIYRVRLGPLNTVEEADQALERVVAAGFPDARIVVD